jgi:hypothetical protein
MEKANPWGPNRLGSILSPDDRSRDRFEKIVLINRQIVSQNMYQCKETNLFTFSSNNTTICVGPCLLGEQGTGCCLLQLSEILGQAIHSGMWASFLLTCERHRGWVNGAFMEQQL